MSEQGSKLLIKNDGHTDCKNISHPFMNLISISNMIHLTFKELTDPFFSFSSSFSLWQSW